MKVELENILDIGTELYSLDENFKIKRKVVVNIQSVFERCYLRMILSIVLNIKTLLYHFKSPFMRMQKTWRKKKL